MSKAKEKDQGFSAVVLSMEMSLPTRVPTLSLERIWTGIFFWSSESQRIRFLPFAIRPSPALLGSTRMVWKVPAGVTRVSRACKSTRSRRGSSEKDRKLNGQIPVERQGPQVIDRRKRVEARVLEQDGNAVHSGDPVRVVEFDELVPDAPALHGVLLEAQ